ncbi:MAG: 50S ribosomal protein L24 [bacterium]|nr:50S ribosomal protein L24 [bacterium]
MKMQIKKNDKVMVLSGKNKGKTGEVLQVIKSTNRAIVSKVNMVKKTVKPTQNQEAGLIEVEAPINLTNLQVVCVKCNKPTRVKKDILSDGKKVRVCKKCGEIII